MVRPPSLLADMTASRLLNIDEVAERLRVSKDTAYRLASTGVFAGTKVGRSWRFSPQAIESYVERGATPHAKLRSASDDADALEFWTDSPDVLLSVDLISGTVRRGNPAAQEKFGRLAIGLVGRSVRSLVVDSQRARIDEIVLALRAGASVSHEESTLATDDGRRIESSLTARANRNGSAEPPRAAFSWRDLSGVRTRACELEILSAGRLANGIGGPNDGIVAADREARLVYCNAKARELLRDLPEIGGRLACVESGAFFLSDGRTPLAEDDMPMRRALNGERTENVDVTIRYPSESDAISLSVRSSPLRGENGAVMGAVCVFQDVTAAKAERERLLCTEFSVRKSPDAVYWLDRDGRFVYANDVACDSLGYSRDEILAMRVSDVDIDFSQKRWAEFQEELHARGNGLFRGRHRSRIGRVFPVEVTAGLLEYEGAEIVCAYVRDVSDRRAAERELLESEARFERAIVASRDGLWDWDVRTNAVWYSPRYRELMGLEADDDFRPSLESWSHRIHPEDVAAVETAVERHLHGAAPYEIEYRLRVESGEYRWFHVRGQAFWDEHGIAVRMSGSTSDVTERRRQHAALEAGKRRLQMLIEEAPASVAMFDRELRYIAHSRMWAQAYSLPDKSLVGRLHYDVFPEVPQQWKTIHDECLAGAVHSCDDDSFVRENGSVTRLTWKIHPWLDDAGDVGGIVMFTAVQKSASASDVPSEPGEPGERPPSRDVYV